MYKNKNIILFAFASIDLKKSAQRLKIQAKKSGYYDEIKILSPRDFDLKMRTKYHKLKKEKKKRGYGYWFWKPEFLNKIINQLKSDDIIHYIDIGCHVQNKNSRFYEYLDMIIETDSWLLPFQYKCDEFDKFNDISFPKREEYKYTKSDLFEFFNFLDKREITHTAQFWAGSFFLKNCQKSKSFLEEWIKIFDNNFDLIDDTSSKLKNFNGFIEHRHDQSAFSLLCKKYNIKSLSAYESEWGEKNNNRTWEHNFENPVLAKRDLRYNIFKRFVNRQLKTFRRYKKFLIN